MAEEKKWAGTTYGSGWMHVWLIHILKYLDIRFLYIFSYLFVVPVCLIFRPSYGIIYRFYHNHFGYSSLKSFWYTYLNHCVFSQIVIDKFAMYAGKKFNIEIEGFDYFQSLAIKEDGFIQLSSHIGNYEIAGYSLIAENKPFNALVYFGEKETIMSNRLKMFSATNIHMIPIKDDMSHLFEIDNALNNGETISMPSDRIWGSKKTVELVFLGSKARFPMGPFSVATMKKLDVLAVNVMKTAIKTYKIYVTPLQYDKNASRKEQIEDLSNKYVKELEKMICMYPTQWFNYFDFWSNGN